MRETQNPYGPPPGGGGYGPPPGGGGGYGPPPGGGYGPPGGGQAPPPGPGVPGPFSPPPAGFGAPPGMAPPGGPGGARTDVVGIMALVSSILGLIGGLINILSGLFGTCCVLCTMGSTVIGVIVFIPSAAGAVMGGISLSRIKHEPEKHTGKGVAMAGLILGILASLLAIAEIILPWFGIACFAVAGQTSP